MTAFFTRIGIAFFAILPFSWLYAMADFLYFILKKVIKYRKKVIWGNLKNSFPNHSDVQLNQIMDAAYRNLCDVTVEGFKGLSMSAEELRYHYKIINPEILTPYFLEKKSVVMAGSHYGNWEWGVIGWALWFQHRVIGIYKPLSNKRVEAVLNQKRETHGMVLASPSETKAAIARAHEEPCILVLFGDQSPSNLESAHRLTFLNQKTAWLHGVGSIAYRNDFPVFYLDTQRVARGFYESRLILLCENSKDFSPEQISKIYAAQAEKIINQKPDDWLWSHKRWKHNLDSGK